MKNPNPDLLPARMLNEYSYCPRLFHLEWVQQEWADNAYTYDGKRIHKRVDQAVRRAGSEPEPEEGRPVVGRSVDLADEELGLVAKIDLVESDGIEATPIDYKRGKLPRLDDDVAWEPERVQLAAQALLLRRHGYRVERGILYFAGSRRRVEVPIDEVLVARTLELRDAARACAESEVAPPPLEDSRKCAGCSLAGICLPDEHALLLRGKKQERLREVRAQRVEAYPLHVTDPGAVVRKSGHELIVEPREGPVEKVRLVDVSSLQLHGAVKVTAPALHELMSRNITISYLSRGNFLYGRTRGPSHKNVLLRIAQYQHATDPDRALALARRFVRAKIRNGRTFLRRNGEGLDDTLSGLDASLTAVDRVDSAESLLGVEGNAATLYFRGLAKLIEGRTPAPFSFERRNRRPARDPVNAMLSFAYALLTTSWTETVDRVGFDAYLGFYHTPKYGRPALALDLMEEFRPIVADSVVYSVLRRGIFDPEDFITTRTACTMSRAGQRKFIDAFERRMAESITHPVFEYKVTYRQVFEVQARLLGRYLTGEIESFPEFVVR